ncbi:MAG: pseudouridine synthase [Bdellovibrionales bacterium]
MAIDKVPEILYENSELLAVYKPEGIICQGSTGEITVKVLVETNPVYKSLHLVHRLDRITSGVLVICKTSAAAAELSQLFQEHKIEKVYWALAGSRPKKKQGWVKGCMKKGRRSQWILQRDGNENFTSTYFESRSFKPSIRFYNLQPKTGKTHQLRVAMKSLSAPILGDPLYQSRQESEKYDRCYLHCYQLRFPWKGGEVSVSALPETGKLWVGSGDSLRRTQEQS